MKGMKYAIGITQIQEIILMSRKASLLNLMEPGEVHTCRENIRPEGRAY